MLMKALAATAIKSKGSRPIIHDAINFVCFEGDRWDRSRWTMTVGNDRLALVTVCALHYVVQAYTRYKTMHCMQDFTTSRAAAY
jgi:hypothetical protein